MYNELPLTSTSGYLSSLTVAESSTVGTVSCPWKIEAQPGRRINLTLFDFTTSSLAIQNAQSETGSKQHGLTWCREGWIVVVREHNMTVEIPGCGVISTVSRQRLAYSSHSNSISVHLEHRSTLSNTEIDQQILIKYQGESL
jgi:hypothetical protein